MDGTVVRRPSFGVNPMVGERGSDTRRRVLDAALEVFAETPYADARVEQITERAGCSRPAFYQYFSSKDDVFWALATQLGREMVGLAHRLEPIAPDEEGLARLTAWVDEFMALHEAWAPVFAVFPAASRGDEFRAAGSGAISATTSRALLRAFGLRRTVTRERLAALLVVVLVRCSFYAEAAPKGMSRTPLVIGLARLFHRSLAGPVEGVNLRRGRSPNRRRIRVVAPEPPPPTPRLRARGEQTRRRLLDAGAAVLAERGYPDTRVDDLADAAGVSHGTFYRYFASKDDFFRVLAGEASDHMVELIDQLELDAPPGRLEAWLKAWFDAYEADGGVISTWQEMRASPELRAFSQQIAASVFTRLEKLLDRRDFGQPQVDAAMLLALLERAPYSVRTLGFASRPEAIQASRTLIRQGFLGLVEP
jgi:AcrR family transcriptional regulator